jgi:hypothetical protein
MTNRGNTVWNELHFISSNATEEDKELFFGPLTGEEEFTVIGDNWKMSHLLHAAGIFPSVSIARKNGENKPIPNGFTHLTRGKKKNRKDIFILCLT